MAIEDEGFDCCDAFRSLKIPKSVININKSVFWEYFRKLRI